MPAVRDSSVDHAKPMMTSESDSTDRMNTRITVWERRVMRLRTQVKGKAIATTTSATPPASATEVDRILPKNGDRNRR